MFQLAPNLCLHCKQEGSLVRAELSYWAYLCYFHFVFIHTFFFSPSLASMHTYIHIQNPALQPIDLDYFSSYVIKIICDKCSVNDSEFSVFMCRNVGNLTSLLLFACVQHIIIMMHTTQQALFSGRSKIEMLVSVFCFIRCSTPCGVSRNFSSLYPMIMWYLYVIGCTRFFLAQVR